MKIPIYTGVLGIAIALCPGALSAVEDIPPLGWNEVARLALEQSPDIRSARIDLAGADAQRLTARQLPNPSLSVSVSKIPTDGTAASTSYGNGFFDRGYDTVVQVAEVLELGGKRARRVRSAAAGHEAATERLADAQRLAVAVARKALIQAVLARETATVARATAASLAKSAAIARDREGSGDLSRADREQVEIAAATFEANAGTAESAARAAALALDAALSLPTPSGRTLPDSLRALSDEAGPGFDSSQSAEELAESDARRVDLRPDLLALGASLRRAESELAVQRALRIPEATLSLQYEREPPNQRNTVGFGVSIPLPVLSRNAGGMAAARAARDAARLELERANVRARVELAVTREVLRAARERSRRYETELLPKAQSVRQSVAAAFSDGATSLLALLEAERNANEVSAQAAGARADLLAARADFEAAQDRVPQLEKQP